MMAANLRNDGNSIGVVLTAQVRELGWSAGDPVLVSVESGRIVIARAVPEPQPAPILPLKNVPENFKDQLEPEELEAIRKGGRA